MILNQIEKTIFINTSALINYILNVPGIKLDCDDALDEPMYYGSHDFINNIIYVNKLYLDNVIKSNNTDKYDYNYSVFCSIVAHETMHFHQKTNPSSQIIKDFVTEIEMLDDTSKFDNKTYVNLSTEIEARAFGALIQEKIIGYYDPINSDIDVDEFNKKYNELKDVYWNKIVEAFKLINY